MLSASSILQEFLDYVGQAVLHDRFDLYSARVVLPFQLITQAANLRIDTPDDLNDGFDEYVAQLHDLGVTRLLRTVIQAKHDGGDRVTGTFETTHLSGDTVVIPRFFSKIWLHRSDGLWKALRIANTTSDARWPIVMHKVSSPAWPPKEVLK